MKPTFKNTPKGGKIIEQTILMRSIIPPWLDLNVFMPISFSKIKVFPFSLLYQWFNKETKKTAGRKKVNIDSIRARLNAQGWSLLEVPVKQRDQKTNKPFVARWKIVATKNQRSIEVGGKNIEEALNNIGKTLGVISKDN